MNNNQQNSEKKKRQAPKLSLTALNKGKSKKSKKSNVVTTNTKNDEVEEVQRISVDNPTYALYYSKITNKAWDDKIDPNADGPQLLSNVYSNGSNQGHPICGNTILLPRMKDPRTRKRVFFSLEDQHIIETAFKLNPNRYSKADLWKYAFNFNETKSWYNLDLLNYVSDHFEPNPIIYIKQEPEENNNNNNNNNNVISESSKRECSPPTFFDSDNEKKEYSDLEFVEEENIRLFAELEEKEPVCTCSHFHQDFLSNSMKFDCQPEVIIISDAEEEKKEEEEFELALFMPIRREIIDLTFDSE